MTRRRPRAVSPSSCGGPRAISALRSGWSVKGLQPSEELAKGARRLACLLLAASIANKRAQLLQVRAGVGADVVGERRVVGQQLLPQRLQPLVACRFGGRLAGQRVELLAQRRRIEVAHQATDVLHLATPAF